MKTILLFSLKLRLSLSLLVALTFLQSCGGKTFQREIKTDEINVNIVGNKPGSLDPYTVGLIVTNLRNNESVTLDIEVYATTLDESNPSFAELGDHKYSLVFSQSDNSKREFILVSSPNEISLEEVL